MLRKHAKIVKAKVVTHLMDNAYRAIASESSSAEHRAVQVHPLLSTIFFVSHQWLVRRVTLGTALKALAAVWWRHFLIKDPTRIPPLTLTVCAFQMGLDDLWSHCADEYSSWCYSSIASRTKRLRNVSPVVELAIVSLGASNVDTQDTLARLCTHLEFQESWSLLQETLALLALRGDIDAGEKLLVNGRQWLLSRYSLGPLDLVETCYFTAIGHQAQLDFLIKVSAQIGASLPRFSVQEGAVPNSCYRDLWLAAVSTANSASQRESVQEASRVAPNDGVPVCDLESVIGSEQTYLIRRRVGSAYRDWEDAGRGPLVSLSEAQKATAIDLLNGLGLPRDCEKLVGIHVRHLKDATRAGRNGGASDLRIVAETVAEMGGWLLSLNSPTPYPLLTEDYPNTIFLDQARVPMWDLLHAFAWSESDFFCGNLSGGTFPAMTFGTPTLWLNIYPLRHFRPPNRRDLMLPKLVMDARRQELLPIRSLLSPHSGFTDTESAFLLMRRELLLRPISEDEISMAVREMWAGSGSGIQSITRNREGVSSSHEILADLYADLQLNHGGEWSEYFLNKWNHLF